MRNSISINLSRVGVEFKEFKALPVSAQGTRRVKKEERMRFSN